MIRSTFWSTSCFMIDAWSDGLLLPETVLYVNPSRRPASAAALCCASQYGVFAPCSSHTMVGFAADDDASPPAADAPAASTTAASAAIRILFTMLPPSVL